MSIVGRSFFFSYSQHAIPADHTIGLPDRILYILCPHAIVDEEFVVISAVRKHGYLNLPYSVVARSQFEFVVRPVVKCACQADVVRAGT